MASAGDRAGDGPREKAAARSVDDALLQRDDERKALDQRLMSTAEGSGSLVVIEGEAGVGKSALLLAAARQAEGRGFARRTATGRELERDAPFGVARRLLEEPQPGAGAQPATVPDLRDPPRPPLATAVITGLVEAVEGLVDADPVSGARPLLLTVDDAHWADRPSLRFIVQLADRLADLPIAVVIALRTDTSALLAREMRWLRTHPAARVLTPQPLGPDAVQQFVQRRFADAEPPFWRACGQASGGNPFLLRELLEALWKDGITGSAGDARAAGALVPDSVLRSVLGRLGRLGGAATALARAVAVLGNAPLREAAALADLEIIIAERAADALAHARILCADEPLRFALPLVAAAVNQDRPTFARARDHRRAAELLAGEGADAEKLAGHLLAAPRDGDPWVVRTLRTAAQAAMASGDPGGAARLLSRALAEPPRVDERADLLLELAHAEAVAGEETAGNRFGAAMALVDDPARRARAGLQLAVLLFARLDLVAASEVAQRAHGDTAGTGPLANALLTIHLIAAALRPDRGAAVEQVSVLRREALDGRLPAGPELMTLVALTMACAGDSPELVRELAERALDEAPADHAFATLLLPMFIPQALLAVDQLEVADTVVDRLLARGEREGHVLASAFARQWRATILLRRGDLREAAKEAARTLAVRAEGWEAATDHAAATLASAQLDLGNVAAARAAIAAGSAAPGRLVRPALLHARGRLALAEGDAAAALEDFKTAGGYLEQAFAVTNPALLPWRSQAALALHRLGDADGARRMAQIEVADARRIGLGRTLGVALRIAGMVAEPERSIALLRESVALLAASPARLEHAHALSELGAALRRQRQRAAAQEPLSQALELAQAAGAAPLGVRIREELHATGRRPRRPARSGPEALTATERRIAKMAARGLSNREIAADLFITVSTVQWHLHNTYGKLGISTRREIEGILGASSEAWSYPRTP